MNYTKEQTEYLREKYLANPSRETVQELAKELGKSTRSITGKLSKENIYRKEPYKAKTGEAPITKVELVHNIAETLGIDVERLSGLEKSPKEVLKTLSGVLAGS